MENTCAILAGGKNSRMKGMDKAFIQVEGIPIIDRILDIVKPLFDEVIVISNKPTHYAGIPGISIFPDEIPDKGPLGGIYTAVKNSVCGRVFVLACDMPYPSGLLISRLILASVGNPGSIIVPRHQGLLEPLFAIYPKSISQELHRFLISSSSLAIYRFIQDSSHVFLEISDSGDCRKAFQNINHQDDLPLNL